MEGCCVLAEVGAAAAAGGLIIAVGGVDFLLSLPPPPRAFLNRPLNPFFSGSGAGETLFERGDGRANGFGVFVPFEIGPCWSGVAFRTVAGEVVELVCAEGTSFEDGVDDEA